MGLIRATVGSVAGTLHDQWKEALRCEDMGNDILMKKVTTKNGVISNGSTVIVAPGQCALLYDNGRIIEATAEEGVYTFDSSSTPSFFAGQFGEVFKEMLQRFTYNGASAKQQAVFFFNIGEIINNNFGTKSPVPFQDWSHPMPNQMTGQMLPLSVKIKCHGKYTFRITDPAYFMSEIAKSADVYTKDELVEQMRSEVVGAFQNVLNELGNAEHKIPVLELPSQTDEIKEILQGGVFDRDIRNRGISIVSFTVEAVVLDEDSERKINNYELSSNSYMQQGTMVGSYSQAVQDAAKNPNGAANGFMGIGMMNMASGGMMGGAATGPWQNNNNQAPVQNQANTNGWECPNCHKQANGNFCPECGTPKPTKAFCPNCGKEITKGAKFCPECGGKIE